MKVSIVIPVYNVEKYLQRCIDSVLNQTFKDFELILIDDGSKDKSYEIMKKNAKSDKRIKIYHQKNCGPAITRNNGIDYAKGKYVMFIDSDDFIDNDYIKKYYNAMISGKYDLVIGGYKKVDDKKTNFIRKLSDGIFSKYIVMGPVCKMYRLSFLKDNNVYFLDTTASEDIYFNELAYSNNPRIKIINDTGYYYYYNESSISNTLHKGFNKKVDIVKFASDINFDSFIDKELNEYFIIRYLIWYLLYSGKSAKSRDFIYEYKNIFKWLDLNIEKYKRNKYLKQMPSGEIRKIYLLIKIFLLLDKFKLVNLFSKIYCRGGK